MQQLCSTPVFLLSRRHFLMQLSSNNCSFSVLGWKKFAVREKGSFLACFPKATGKTGQMYIYLLALLPQYFWNLLIGIN